MKYFRKDRRTNKLLFFFVLVTGIVLIYLGYNKLHWTWNIVAFPFGLILVILGYKNYKRTTNKIHEIEFKDNSIRIILLNGTMKEIKNKQLSYSLLVKKFFKPVRAIQLFEKKNAGLFKLRSLGIIDFSKWENDLKPIAQHLIKNEFERTRWKFGWTTGDLLMFFAIFLGVTEGITERYVGTQLPNLSDPIGDLGTMVSDENNKSIIKTYRSEEEYLKKSRD